MKKILSIVLCFCVLVCLFPMGTLATSAGQGLDIWDGTTLTAPTDRDGDYKFDIVTPEELAYVIYNGGVMNGTTGHNFVFKNDIYLNDPAAFSWMTGIINNGYSVNEWFHSAGDTSATKKAVRDFSGNIDGNGYVVYGIYKKGMDAYGGYDGCALVPGVDETGVVEIKNIGIDNVYIEISSQAAGFVGYNLGTVQIYNCFSGANVRIWGENVGIFVGYSEGSNHLTNCFALNAGGFGLLSDKAAPWEAASATNCYAVEGSIINKANRTVVNCYETVAGASPANLRTVENMQGTDALTNADKMSGLGSSAFVATETYPVLRVFTDEAKQPNDSEDNSTPPASITVGSNTYSYVWGDEFNGNALDSDKWVATKADTRMGTFSDLELSAGSDTISVSNGKLNMTAYYKASSSKYVCPVTVQTHEKMEYRYGYLEISAKVPYKYGAWPGFWLSTGLDTDTRYDVDSSFNNRQNFDYHVEVDVFEVFGDPTTATPNIHRWYNINGTKHHDMLSNGYTYRNRSYTFTNSANLSNEYHTYGFEWTPTAMSMYIDGTCYKTFNLTSAYTLFGYDAYNNDLTGFQDPMFVMFNNHLFTQGATDAGYGLGKDGKIIEDYLANLPAEFQVDWIRLYQNSSVSNTQIWTYENDPWTGEYEIPVDTDEDWKFDIYTPEEFAYVIKNGGVVNNGAGHNFVLHNDLYFNDLDAIDWTTGEVDDGKTVNSWFTSGTNGSAAMQTTKIWGNGYTIYGLYNDGGDGSCALIPSVASNATINIYNLGIDNAYINVSNHAAAFVGASTGGTVNIDGCYAGQDVRVAGRHPAVFSSYNDKALTLTNSYALNANGGYLVSSESAPYGQTNIKKCYVVNGAIVNKVNRATVNCYETISGASGTNASLRTVNSMKGMDVLTNDSKMSGLGSAFTATKSYPVLTVFGIPKDDECEHDFKWVIDSEATCGMAGVKHEECEICYTVRSENTAIEPTEDHDFEWVVDTEPTCEDGVKHEECTVCEATRNENTAIEATDEHDYEWVIDTEATCGDAGVKHEECTVCFATRNENTRVDATGEHSYDNDTDAVCNNCDYVRELKNGWVLMDGVWYYYQNGELSIGWVLDFAWYYMDASGAMMTGWQIVDGTWYYFNAGGDMATGWINLGGTWYYFLDSGAMQTGWVYDGANWYYLNEGGAMVTGWQYIGGNWYYLSSSGAMVTGWLYDGASWYYLNSSGAMMTGWQIIDGTWYYFNAGGDMATGWLNLGGTWYYLNASGAMMTGWQLIGGTWYYMDASGAWIA